jgi:hypothetical protein
MKTQTAEHPASTTITPEEVQGALDKILGSKYFVNAHKKKEFLRLICDFHIKGRASELNEYILGYEVFARDDAYNPSGDPIVRVFAHEIRKKLENYYKTEGSNDPIRLAIPAGTYQPVFTRQVADTAITPEKARTTSETLIDTTPPVDVEHGWRRLSPGIVWMSFAVLCLAIAVVSLVMSNRQLRQRVSDVEASQDTATNGEVWAPFLKDNSPPLVILSNPPVLRFTNPSDPEPVTRESIPLAPETVRALQDKFVTNPEVSIKDSAGPASDSRAPIMDRVTIERNRTPSLILSTNVYTGMGEAIGLHYLTDFFRKAGRNIVLKQSRTLSAEDLRKHNVILLGGVWVNEWSSKLTRSVDFVFTNKATIENRNPQTGEEPEYIPQFDRRTGGLIVDYAVITVKPNIADANQVMLLAGIYSQGTEAAAEFVTNKSYHDQLNQRLLQAREADRSPRNFQVLLKVGVENGIPTIISIIALHELPPSEP